MNKDGGPRYFRGDGVEEDPPNKQPWPAPQPDIDEILTTLEMNAVEYALKEKGYVLRSEYRNQVAQAIYSLLASETKPYLLPDKNNTDRLKMVQAVPLSKLKELMGMAE